MEFKTNQDIGWIKHLISQKFNINHSDFDLFFMKNLMHPILSLSDIKGLSNGQIV